MAFLRVVDVLPPIFPASARKGDDLRIDAEMERFTEEVRSVRDFADVFLVANVKNPGLLKLDTLRAATMLRETLGVEAAPVIVVRDQNRAQFLASVLTGFSMELSWMMIAWGDDYQASANVTNVRDFASLAEAIRTASLVRSRAHAPTRLLAPVDLRSLGGRKGVALARGRLRAGAEILLAQPPTTDADESFDQHASAARDAGLERKVLPNVFHFRDEKDVRRYERLFGWRLPKRLHEAAARGEDHLIELEREVVRRLREEGYPGVYLSTRGDPALAERILS